MYSGWFSQVDSLYANISSMKAAEQFRQETFFKCSYSFYPSTNVHLGRQHIKSTKSHSVNNICRPRFSVTIRFEFANPSSWSAQIIFTNFSHSESFEDYVKSHCGWVLYLGNSWVTIRPSAKVRLLAMGHYQKWAVLPFYPDDKSFGSLLISFLLLDYAQSRGEWEVELSDLCLQALTSIMYRMTTNSWFVSACQSWGNFH